MADQNWRVDGTRKRLPIPLLPAAALFLVLSLLLAAPSALLRAQDIPRPVGHVNDFANVIDDDVEVELERILRLSEEETSAEIVTVTVPDLGGTTIEDYAVRLFEDWGIGQRSEDNGVLLILAVAEREVRIEVGYGLEGVIPDGRAGRILDEAVLPELAEGNYTLGILGGLYEIQLAIEGGGAAVPQEESGPSVFSSVFDFLAGNAWIVISVGTFSLYAFGFMARTKSIWLGGIWGGGIGWLAGWIIFGVGAGFIGLAAGAVIGLIIDAILSTAYHGQVSSGRSTSWGSTWGGFGGFGTGMRTGGGFGGFGGGRSGGGGASRRF